MENELTHEVTPEGVFVNGQRVFVSLSGGRLHFMIRAKDRQAFLDVALSVNLLVHTQKEIPAVLDPETGEELHPLVPASGELVPVKHATVVELGSLILTPAEYDEEGNEVTPAVVDERHHVNAWLGPELVAKGAWKKWAIQWSQYGQPVTPNAEEAAVVLNTIELIDPATVRSPSNTIL